MNPAQPTRKTAAPHPALSQVWERVSAAPTARRLAAWLLQAIFATHMSFILPVHRLRETSTLLAFYHPKPSYRLHIVLTSKKAIASLADLDPIADGPFLRDLFSAVASLATEFKLEAGGYRLIANGGAYQDFPHLHFHLIADQPPAEMKSAESDTQ